MTDNDPDDDPEADREATAAEIARMMQSQAGQVTQDDIPPSLDLSATMEAAWKDFANDCLPKDLPKKLQDDCKFVFYNGVRAAVNLCIFCAGHGNLEAATDQIIAECLAYEKEAEEVCRRRAAGQFPAGDGLH